MPKKLRDHPTISTLLVSSRDGYLAFAPVASAATPVPVAITISVPVAHPDWMAVAVSIGLTIGRGMPVSVMAISVAIPIPICVGERTREGHGGDPWLGLHGHGIRPAAPANVGVEGQSLGHDLVHVVVTIGCQAADKMNVAGLFRQRLIFFVELSILRPGDWIIRVALRA
jgi:hypothetical protein